MPTTDELVLQENQQAIDVNEWYRYQPAEVQSEIMKLCKKQSDYPGDAGFSYINNFITKVAQGTVTVNGTKDWETVKKLTEEDTKKRLEKAVE